MFDGCILVHDGAITLRDGRTLAYAEYGDPAGHPIMLFHGMPGARLVHPSAIRAGFSGTRIISVDRPGYGFSSLHTEGGMLDHVDDVAELANALGIERFAVAGVSGGGAYTAACAYRMPERVRAAGLISSPAPFPPDRRSNGESVGNTEGLDEEAVAARSLSWPNFLAWFTEQHGGMPQDVAQIMAFFADWLPECDKQVLALPDVRASFRIALSEVFRQGISGWARDSWTLSRPWGFYVDDIRVPTYLWHGELDQTVPVEDGKYLAEAIPICQATFYPETGHLFPPEHWGAILTALVKG